jgi:hypothetical protein
MVGVVFRRRLRLWNGGFRNTSRDDPEITPPVSYEAFANRKPVSDRFAANVLLCESIRQVRPNTEP